LTAGPQTKSNGNHIAGTAIGNLSVVPVDADGTFCIYNQQSVNLVVDVQGYFTTASADGLLFSPQAPERRLDTRVAPLSIPAAGSITKVNTGVGAGAAAVLVNIAMVDGAAPGYVTADKCSALTAGAQSKANGNHVVGAAIGNLSVVPVDADGTFCIYNQRRVNLVVDVQGSFSKTGTEQFFSVLPTRALDTRR
jgi:hypothetical protein